MIRKFLLGLMGFSLFAFSGCAGGVGAASSGSTAPPSEFLRTGAEVAVVDFFDMYCHTCQTAASHVNKLHSLVQSRGLGSKIAFYAIGMNNTEMEANLYRTRFKVPLILSFVPAAFTPVCSAQWPGYHLASGIFDRHDAVMLGITTDNLPSLHAWTSLMGELGFEVLSDFWPHGKVSQSFGVLRSDGTTERAPILIDKQGVIRWIDVHDINVRPPIEELAAALENL